EVAAEGGEGLAERGLRHAEDLRGPREAVLAEEHLEDAQVAQLEVEFVSFGRHNLRESESCPDPHSVAAPGPARRDAARGGGVGYASSASRRSWIHAAIASVRAS